MLSHRQQDIPSIGGVGGGFKVVLFDMDGVLYDSMPNHGVAWQRAMKEFGIHFTLEDVGLIPSAGMPRCSAARD